MNAHQRRKARRAVQRTAPAPILSDTDWNAFAPRIQKNEPHFARQAISTGCAVSYFEDEGFYFDPCVSENAPDYPTKPSPLLLGAGPVTLLLSANVPSTKASCGCDWPPAMAKLPERAIA